MPTSPTVHNALIRLDDVSMQWGEKRILSSVNVTINRGDFMAITGPNGGGKTTLLRIILKLIKPTRGEISYFKPNGEPCRTLPIGYLPQKNMIDSRFPISVYDVVASGLLKSRLSSYEKSEKVRHTLEIVELEQHASSAIGTLSGGQLQRALLGRAIISNPKVIVLDEPLSYLDKHFEQRTYMLLENLAKNATIILVSHEMSVISTMATRHIIVDHTIHECNAPRHYVQTECR